MINGETFATSSCSNTWPSATLNQRVIALPRILMARCLVPYTGPQKALPHTDHGSKSNLVPLYLQRFWRPTQKRKESPSGYRTQSLWGSLWSKRTICLWCCSGIGSVQVCSPMHPAGRSRSLGACYLKVSSARTPPIWHTGGMNSSRAYFYEFVVSYAHERIITYKSPHTYRIASHLSVPREEDDETYNHTAFRFAIDRSKNDSASEAGKRHTRWKTLPRCGSLPGG
jgi:hypothetical protein